MCEQQKMTIRRRNALADIFEGLSQEKIDQLQRFVNTDSGFEDESPVDVIDPTTTATTTPSQISSTNLNRCIDQSNPIDIPHIRQASLNGVSHDQIAASYLGFRGFDSSNEDTLSDEEDDERFVAFVNSPRYHQRRFGVVENVFLFRENPHMMMTGIVVASH